MQGKQARVERVKGSGDRPNNDLYLTNRNMPLQISREHLAIQKSANGYQLLDRRSACGSAVGDIRIGGRDSGGAVALKDGDIISIGTSDTPYIFKFIAF